MKKYNSEADTKAHIFLVGAYIGVVVLELVNRKEEHDASKLLPPEKEIFDEVTPLLRGLTYGSDDYKAMLGRIKPALDHHYKNNRHHPEYFENGIDGMNLIDLIEMICDWKSATARHADGDIYRSLEINKERFGISDQLANILKNTVDFFVTKESE